MSNSPRYEPSMDSLKLAVELARINGGTRAAFDVTQDAALFDAYLFGDLIVALRINDGAPNLPNFKRAPHCFNRGIEILKHLVSFQPPRLCPARFYKNIKQSQNHVFVRRSHSSSPSSASKDARADSHSEAGNETVAQGTQTERPDHETLSEQERRDRVNLSVQTALREYREERLTNPTDKELQEWGCPKLLDPRARMFICQLPDEDLRTIRRHAMPGWLAGLLSQIAYEEIERRSGEDEASS